MPRPFSDSQRAEVHRKILSAATQLFGKIGYRKTTMGEIADAAWIAKGTLYLFFDSKGLLFLATALEAEARHRDDLLRLLDELASETPRKQIRAFLEHGANALQNDPILSVMVDPIEGRALMRDMPPEKLAALSQDDDTFFEQIAIRWREAGVLGDVDPDLLSALPRAVFALVEKRDLIGTERFPAVLDIMLEGLVDRLLKTDAGGAS